MPESRRRTWKGRDRTVKRARARLRRKLKKAQKKQDRAA